MVSSKAATVAEYLASLPGDRRDTIAAVREVVVKHLPAGYQEAMNWGMICWQVPLERYPDTYNGKPLGYVALASQKRYCSLYLTCAYMSDHRTSEMAVAFAKAGKKLDMGRCCIRFKRADDLPLTVIGKIVRSTGVKKFIAEYEAARANPDAAACKPKRTKKPRR